MLLGPPLHYQEGPPCLEDFMVKSNIHVHKAAMRLLIES